ncbi:MAG: ABC transporter permease [Acidimicrobiales bacterium]|nr:ABC transporter permease [Acidimicrobiales bacterium]MDP7117996.1 ABC transporter permease [Acidimicrobiales bacterium]MDP7410138.1 ABC transporter permease [Acidimicrobiales bacterium]MDP7550776.1 ABC transporter permease [Acidimicrobiales bacterium]MEE1522542.1 ABC transporter permease [Acidimicrobiales bacterium]
MGSFIAIRLVRLVATLLAVSFLTFLLVNLLPGDAINALIPIEAQQDQEYVAQVRAEWGLNDPMLVRYGKWLGDAVRGDLGESIVTSRAVSSEIAHRIPVTGELMIVTVVFSVLMAVPLGVMSAYREGSRLDQVISGGAQFALSVPGFVAGLLFIYVFAMKLGWFPATGWTRISNSISGNLMTVTLPALSLSVIEVAVYARVVRSDLVTTLKEDYILSARSKGLRDGFILFRHALRPSSLTLITVVGLNIGLLLGGTVVVEFLFALPGLGKRLLDAIFQRDFMMVQGITVFVAMVYVVVNTLVDLVYLVVDPRIRKAD